MRSSPFEPEPIDVITIDNRPARVRYKKRLQGVEEISDLWRIDDNWWQKPVTRCYYVLALESGSRITIFHDLLTGKWYRQNWTA